MHTRVLGKIERTPRRSPGCYGRSMPCQINRTTGTRCMATSAIPMHSPCLYGYPILFCMMRHHGLLHFSESAGVCHTNLNVCDGLWSLGIKRTACWWIYAETKIIFHPTTILSHCLFDWCHGFWLDCRLLGDAGLTGSLPDALSALTMLEILYVPSQQSFPSASHLEKHVARSVLAK